MSIKDKIAPGKWSFASFGLGKFQRQLETTNGNEWEPMGVVDLYTGDLEEAEAVFSSIAAIPEMLDILERLADENMPLGEWRKIKQDAIKLLNTLNK